MRHKLVLLTLGITMLSVCPAPPAVAQDVGKHKQEQVIGTKYLAPTTYCALTPMPIFNEAVCLLEPEVVHTANVPGAVPIQTSSKPLSTGLAIRRRGQLHLANIIIKEDPIYTHAVYTYTQHIDPGLY